MPITMIIKGTREDAMRESEKRALAFIMLEKYQPHGTTEDYVKIMSLDTEDNRAKVWTWMGESTKPPFGAGTLLHYSYTDGKTPSVTLGEVVQS